LQADAYRAALEIAKLGPTKDIERQSALKEYAAKNNLNVTFDNAGAPSFSVNQPNLAAVTAAGAYPKQIESDIQLRQQSALADFKAQLDAANKRLEQIGQAQFTFHPSISPQTGLPGYTSGLGQPMTAPGGQPVTSENPYKDFQLKEIGSQNDAADKARNYRQLADDFVANYQNINKPGYGADTMQGWRKMAQQIGQYAGVAMPQLAQGTSSYEAAKFIGQQLVAAATKDLSPRAALGLVEQINRVKLSPEITPQGVERMRNMIYATTQEPIDRGTFTSQYYNSPQGALRNDAQTAFNGQYPIEGYGLIANGANPKYVSQLRQIANSGDAQKLQAARTWFDGYYGPGASVKVLGR
jgi:hypothetical protein